jgi:hypothetical protein
MLKGYVFKLEKQPYEVLTRDVDFAAELDTGETLIDKTVTAIDEEDKTDASSIVLQGLPQIVNGNKPLSAIAQQIKDGEAGKIYKITFKGVTSNGNQLEAELRLFVGEL